VITGTAPKARDAVLDVTLFGKIDEANPSFDENGVCKQRIAQNQGFCQCNGSNENGVINVVPSTRGNANSCALCVGCIDNCDLACLTPIQ